MLIFTILKPVQFEPQTVEREDMGGKIMGWVAKLATFLLQHILLVFIPLGQLQITTTTNLATFSGALKGIRDPDMKVYSVLILLVKHWVLLCGHSPNKTTHSSCKAVHRSCNQDPIASRPQIMYVHTQPVLTFSLAIML